MDAATRADLDTARALRVGRDQWRTEVGPILARLRAADVSFREIATETGISPATAHAMITRSSVTTARRGSTAPP